MISIVVSVYNVVEYLPRCIDSLLKQSYKDLDIILVDDGSADGSGEICDLFSKKDPRVRVVHTVNHGLSEARNIGITKALERKSDFIGFVDGDDWAEKDMYLRLLEASEKYDADIAECGCFVEYRNTTAASPGHGRVYEKDNILKAVLLGKIGNAVMLKLWRASLWENIFFPEGHVYEDIPVTCRTGKNANRLVHLPVALYHYTQRRSSIVHTYSVRHLTDYWTANKTRYHFFLQETSLASDQDINDFLLESCAHAALKVWRWYYLNTPKERSRGSEYLKEIAGFSRKYLLPANHKKWPFYLRAGTLLTSVNHPASLRIAWLLNRGYHGIRYKSLKSRMFYE